MYGTIAQMRAKTGMEEQLIEHLRSFEAAQVPGFVTAYCYRMDANAKEYYIAVVFASKKAYRQNAQSPEQDARYRQMLSLLESEPVWHDGEIVSVLKETATATHVRNKQRGATHEQSYSS
jgi:quinol monooxygenase YgiN